MPSLHGLLFFFSHSIAPHTTTVPAPSSRPSSSRSRPPPPTTTSTSPTRPTSARRPSPWRRPCAPRSTSTCSSRRHTTSSTSFCGPTAPPPAAGQGTPPSTSSADLLRRPPPPAVPLPPRPGRAGVQPGPDGARSRRRGGRVPRPRHAGRVRRDGRRGPLVRHSRTLHLVRGRGPRGARPPPAPATGARRGRRHEQPLQQAQGRQVRAGGVEDRCVRGGPGVRLSTCRRGGWWILPSYCVLGPRTCCFT